MRKHRSQQKSGACFDSEDNNSMNSSSADMSELTLASETEAVWQSQDTSLDLYLDALYDKRGSTREKALTIINEAFTKNLQHQFMEKNFVALLHHYLHSIKRGSAREICLASRAIGLLALTTDCEDKAHELLEESLFPLSEALKSGSEISKISQIIESLAVITFIGGKNQEEAEGAMQIIWEFICQKTGSKIVVSKLSPAVITTAISAWSFILTTTNGWVLNSKIWQEAASHLSSFLVNDDRSVRIAAGEALAILFEFGCPKKYSSEAIQQLVEKILDQVGDLSAEAGGRGSKKKDLGSQRNFFGDLLEFLKDGYCPETSMKIGGDLLNTSTWSELIQLNFLKRFLGGGFFKHMKENELLRAIFQFTPTKQHMSSSEKKLRKSQIATSHKAMSRELNKQRAFSQLRKSSHFAAGDSEWE
ncbi:interferon-related developmental regulator 1-like isoform X1 [Fagus crenata]